MLRFLPRSVLVFLATCVVSATPAHALGSAAPFDLRTYRPAFSEFSLGSIDLPRVGPGLGQGNAFAYADYTYRPLVYTQGNQPLFDLLTHRITLDTGFALTVWRNRLQLGLALPVTVYQAGQLPPPDATTRPLVDLPLPSTSLEDLHLLAKGVFYHSGGDPLLAPKGGIGLLLDLTLPTGNADAFSGSRYPTLTAALLASFAYQRVTAAVQFGGLFSSSEALYAQAVAHALQQRGVSPERLHPRPDAFYCPVTDTQHTEPLQMQNHRVSLHWVHPNQPLDEVSTCTIP